MRNIFIPMIFGTAVSAGAESKSAKSVAEVSEQYWQMMLQDPSERLKILCIIGTRLQRQIRD